MGRRGVRLEARSGMGGMAAPAEELHRAVPLRPHPLPPVDVRLERRVRQHLRVGSAAGTHTSAERSS